MIIKTAKIDKISLIFKIIRINMKKTVLSVLRRDFDKRESVCVLFNAPKPGYEHKAAETVELSELSMSVGLPGRSVYSAGQATAFLSLLQSYVCSVLVQ